MLGLHLGLGLAQRKPLGPPELVTTPYTGTVVGSWAVGASSVTRNSSPSGGATLTSVSAPTIGQTYAVKFDVADWSGDPFVVRYGNAASGQINSNGSKLFTLTATNTNKLIFGIWAGGVAGETTVTNISVKAA